MTYTCNVQSDELFHNIEQSLVGPNLAEPFRKVTHFVQKDSSSLELLLYQSEPFIKASIFTLVLDLASFV